MCRALRCNFKVQTFALCIPSTRKKTDQGATYLKVGACMLIKILIQKQVVGDGHIPAALNVHR